MSYKYKKYILTRDEVEEFKTTELDGNCQEGARLADMALALLDIADLVPGAPTMLCDVCGWTGPINTPECPTCRGDRGLKVVESPGVLERVRERCQKALALDMAERECIRLQSELEDARVRLNAQPGSVVSWCPECGPEPDCDEDGCCCVCGTGCGTVPDWRPYAAELETARENARAATNAGHQFLQESNELRKRLSTVEAERDEARAGYDALDANWDKLHSASVNAFRSVLNMPDATIPEMLATIGELRANQITPQKETR